MSIQLEDARREAQELASNGCCAHTILSHLYAGYDGLRFYEAKGRVWAEGEDVYFPPQPLCFISTNPRG
jgi:hypothetical protein